MRCVVVSPVAGGVTALSELPGGLQLTEWHPVWLPKEGGGGAWHFPAVVGARVLRRIGAVYNLVLQVQFILYTIVRHTF